MTEVVMFILFSLMMLTVGLGFGVLLKALHEKETIRRLEKDNRNLRKEIYYLRKVQKGKVIEIRDERLDFVRDLDFPK